MFAFFKASRRVALTAGLVMLPLTAALAQAPQIAVPQPPGGPGGGYPAAGYEGCYAINQDLYGPYRMSFCLNRNGNGSYWVTGGGLNCNGWLGWSERRNGTAQISLQHSWCGRGVGWTADVLVCSAQQPQWPPFPPFGGPGWWWQNGQQQPGARIAVPTPPPVATSLRCTYQPAVRGYQAISVLADRTR